MAAPSYAAFGGGGAAKDQVNWLNASPIALNVAAVLDAIKSIAGQYPDLIALDMPLSRIPISGRRLADNLISAAFGAAWAATLSPSPVRPGFYGREVQARLEEHGYVLKTSTHETHGRQLIEVYPHTALIRLLDSEKRLPYKAAKRSKYWPELSAEQRTVQLNATWTRIAVRLDDVLPGSGKWISDARAHCRSLKAVEDVIDAIVSAWVGVCFLREWIESPYGDDDAAIWVPSANTDGRKVIGREGK